MDKEKGENKYVIYFAGGTMTGVFGAGVAAALEKADFHPKVSAVYGASAGSMTGAYFLSRQIEVGLSVYTEDLGKNFVKIDRGFVNAWKIFKNRFIKAVPKEEFTDALDIGHLMQVIENKKPLNTQKVIAQEIPLYIKLFNLDTYGTEYIDARGPEILKVLEAGVSVFPYVNKITHIEGKRYIDGAIMDIVGADYLRKRHPGEKIIIVLNRGTEAKLQYRAKNILEGQFMKWLFNDSKLYKPYATAEDGLARDLRIIKSDSQFILITPERNAGVKSRTTDPKLLSELYDMGIKQGEKFWFLRKNSKRKKRIFCSVHQK